MLETFTYEMFAQHLGSTFRIEADAEHSIEAELVEAISLVDHPTPNAQQEQSRRAPFSIVFRGPRTIIFPQRIYRLVHAELGTFEIFLVPLGQDQLGFRYEAIFN